MPKILLVEDDTNLRDIYSARFSAEQYQVVAATDGEEALAMAMREKPDIILLDIMIPKISGFDVLDIIRQTPEIKSTKVVIMTALSQADQQSKGQGLGANRYLIKSQVTLEDVVRAVKEVLAELAPAPVAPAP